MLYAISFPNVTYIYLNVITLEMISTMSNKFVITCFVNVLKLTDAY